MAPLFKRARDNNDSPNDGNDERRRREEKRRREDERVAEADARLEKEQRVKRRERQRARKAAEEARIRAAVALYVATRGRGRENEDEVAEEVVSAVAGSSTGPGTREREETRAKEPVAAGKMKGEEPKGPLRDEPCLACVQRGTECHTRLAKGARTCWECKQRHGRCGTVARVAPAASAEPTVAQALGDMAAQVFDLSVTSLNRSEALTRLERKIDALTETVRWIAGVMGAADVAAQERDLKMGWAKSLERIAPASEDGAESAEDGDEMDVDGARAPLTSSTGDEEPAGGTDDEEEEEEEEERRDRKGKGRAREETETSQEESSEEE